MKNVWLIPQLCGLLLFCALLFVFAPIVKSRVEARWLPHAQPVPPPVPVSAPVPSPAPLIDKEKPSVPKAAIISRPNPATRSVSKPMKVNFAPSQSSPVIAVVPPADKPDIPPPVSTPDPPRYDPPIPVTKTRSFVLQAGHSITLNNSEYTDFEVHSSGPIRVLAGDCYAPLTFQFECHGQIADIRIKDLRSSAQVGPNVVVITAAKP